MLGINMNDVITTLGLLKDYLIGIGVVLALAIVISIAAIWIKKPFKGLLRGTSWVRFLLVTALLINAILGAAESGVYAFMKHFALNDQETHRTDMLCTWTNEQAMREIYLKPFEICVKEGKCGAVMSAFNYIGNKYAAATTELQNDVLRGEWGFKGMVLTDYFGGYGYQDADILIRNGNDFCLTPQATDFSKVTDTTSATSVLAMRTAAHNILYTTANSRAYVNGNGGSTATWEIVKNIILAAVIVLCAFLEFLIIRKFLKGLKAKKA